MRLIPLVSLLLALGGQAAPPPPYASKVDPKTAIADAVKSANVDGIRVFVNWGTNDDTNAVKFAAALRSPAVNAMHFTADEYRVVNIDIGHLDRNMDLASAYGMKLQADQLPAVTILDRTGNVVARAMAPDFFATSPAATATPAGNTFDPDKIAAFLVANRAPAADAAALVETARKQAKQDGKTLFVWFSAPW